MSLLEGIGMSPFWVGYIAGFFTVVFIVIVSYLGFCWAMGEFFKNG